MRWPFAGGEAGDRGRASIKGCLVAACLMDSEVKLYDHNDRGSWHAQGHGTRTSSACGHSDGARLANRSRRYHI